MYNISNNYLEAFKTPARQVVGSVKCGDLTLRADNNLVNFVIERTAPKGKLFGFAISQKITVEALGILSTIEKGQVIAPSLYIQDKTEILKMPNFYVETVEINKVNNTTTITGYDLITANNNFIIDDLTFTYPLNLSDYAEVVVNKLGGVIDFNGLDFEITEPPNLNGDERLQYILTAIAEASGSICYVSQENTIKFRKVSASDASTDTLTADNYFNFTTGEETILEQISVSNQLGDNVTAGSANGYTQVLWENPFLILREDLAERLTMLFINVNRLSNKVYNLEWRGCPAYEIGDYITVQEKDGVNTKIAYFNETLTYNGGLRAVSNWEAGEPERVEASPPSISTAIKQTHAKVDKINQEIDLLAKKIEESDVGAVTEQLANLKLTTEGITAEVSRLETDIDTIENKVESTMTAENLSILISGSINSVKTETGFTFDSSGLTIAKTDAATKTTISENGMTIYNMINDPVLTANNTGVAAYDLHARTYLVIGDTSRFEDYENLEGQRRTGCFWIG